MKHLIGFILLCCLSTTEGVYAGSASGGEANLNPDDITKFAKAVEQYAALKGARVFLIGRKGRADSELPKGINFTHTAIAVYSKIELADGKTAMGYAIHNLYQDEDNLKISSLVMDYPVDFFWPAFELKAGIIIPTPELQQRLLEAIATGVNKTVHNQKYSILSNPFNDELQNCTEHTLDIINAAIYQTTDVSRLKANAKAHFKPQNIRKTLKLAFGSLFMNDLTTRDHHGKIYTTTFTTIGQYLVQNKLVAETVIFNEDGSAIQLL
ncbi:MAG: DUF2145 domain-containing protein [Gammaproteobacteria bacterium]|nr:DUF2145 domain-containing protein [Gammaproteobacteria bacterium]